MYGYEGPYASLLVTQCVIQIACGCDHTLVVTDDGKLYTWGYNNNGQLGNGTKNSSQTPVPIGEEIGMYVSICFSSYEYNYV